MPEWHGDSASGSAPVSVDLVQAWLDDYVIAWKTYDPVLIAALWSADAIWYYPFGVRAHGRESITAEWMSERDDFIGEVFDAKYEPVAIDGDRVVAHGRTVFYDSKSDAVVTVYDNIWLLRFDADGRCAEFHEWYSGRPEDEPDRAIPTRE